MNIKQGVPDGSTLGPLLFILSVNIYLQPILFRWFQFSDDTTTVISERTKVKLPHIDNQ